MSFSNRRYTKAVAIVTSDTVDFSNPPAPNRCCDAIYVGGAGIAAVVAEDGAVTNWTVVAGGYIFLKARRVNVTNTTATLLLALYEI